MKLEIIKGSENYTCQVIKLPAKKEVKGLDNLVEVVYQGNSCLIGKDSDPNDLYLFFPAGCQLSDEFVKNNNLYRHAELNNDKNKKGFFEDNRRVKAIKFKGIISSGFIIPIDSLKYTKTDIPGIGWDLYDIGDEFNSIDGIEICKKYKKPSNTPGTPGSRDRAKIIDEILQAKMAPEHPDTSHLLKNIHKLNLNDTIAVTYKLHGTSARYYNTLVKRKLSLLERLSKFFGAKIQEEEYKFVCASRRVIKSIDGEESKNKNNWYDEDLWTKVGLEYELNKSLNKGEAIYCEIIGKTYDGKDIQSGYSYGYESPRMYIYRISNINSQGIEVDLSYQQMQLRAEQLGIEVCPELFHGTLENLLLSEYSDKMGAKSYDESGKLKSIDYNEWNNLVFNNLEAALSKLFYNELLEKPSILDKSVVEEGFCIRKDTCNKPEIFKVKSKQFLLHEGKQLDKEVKDIEEEQNVQEEKV